MDLEPIPLYISGFAFMIIAILGLRINNVTIIIGAYSVGITLFWWGISIGERKKAQKATYNRWLMLARVLKNMDKKLDAIKEMLQEKKSQ